MSLATHDDSDIRMRIAEAVGAYRTGEYQLMETRAKQLVDIAKRRGAGADTNTIQQAKTVDEASSEVEDAWCAEDWDRMEAAAFHLLHWARRGQRGDLN